MPVSSQGENPLQPPSDDQLARRACEVAGAGLGDDQHDLEAHATELRQIDAGLHRDDVTWRQRLRPRAPDGRHLVDLEADTVAGAVDEAARGATVLRALLPGAERVVSGLPDDVLDQLVHLAARDA